MKQNNTIDINLSFLPINMISNWKRTSLSADFCANLFSNDSDTSKYNQNSLSTVINDILENIIKYGVNKRKPYEIKLKTKDSLSFQIEILTYLTKKQIKLLHFLLNHIKNTSQDKLLNEKFFTNDYTNLIFSIYNLITHFNSSIIIRNKDTNDTNIKMVTLIIETNTKEV